MAGKSIVVSLGVSVSLRAPFSPTQPLAALAKTAGIDDDKFAQCLSDKAMQDKIINSRKEAEDKYQVDATPTFLIMDQKLAGAQSYEVFKQLIDAQLQKVK